MGDRLTELGYMTDQPTRDFLKWDGTLFHEQKSPKHYLRKKQNPVPLDGTGCTAERYIQVYRQTEQLPEEVYRRTVHIDDDACTAGGNISRFNHSPAPEVLPQTPRWSAPVLVEVTDPAECERVCLDGKM